MFFFKYACQVLWVFKIKYDHIIFWKSQCNIFCASKCKEYFKGYLTWIDTGGRVAEWSGGLLTTLPTQEHHGLNLPTPKNIFNAIWSFAYSIFRGGIQKLGIKWIQAFEGVKQVNLNLVQGLWEHSLMALLWRDGEKNIMCVFCNSHCVH